MTLEEKRFLDECKKKFDPVTYNIVNTAISTYGIKIEYISRLLQMKLTPHKFDKAIEALLEGIDGKELEFLLDKNWNSYVMQEIMNAYISGYSLEELKEIVIPGRTAQQIRSLRKQKDEEKYSGLETEKRNNYDELLELFTQTLQKFNQTTAVLENIAANSTVGIKEDSAGLKATLDECQLNIAAKEKIISNLREEIQKKNHEIVELRNKNQIHMNKVVASNSDSAKLAGIRGIFGKNTDKRREVEKKLVETNLSPDQLEQIRLCFSDGCKYELICDLINETITAERMRGIREISKLVYPGGDS